MTLGQAFSEHLVAGQQGQLVIKFVGDVHLCKILVEDGRAVHISHGRVSPEEILGTLASKTVEWVNFIAGYPVRKKLDFPLHENLIATVSGASAPAPPAAAPAPAPAAQEPPAQAAAPAAEGPEIPAEKIAAAIDGFIDRVGPLGTILAEKAAGALGHIAGNPMPMSHYTTFIDTLSQEVPEDERSEFIEQFKL